MTKSLQKPSIYLCLQNCQKTDDFIVNNRPVNREIMSRYIAKTDDFRAIFATKPTFIKNGRSLLESVDNIRLTLHGSPRPTSLHLSCFKERAESTGNNYNLYKMRE